MLFNSFEFLLFLPIVFALYWLLQKELKLQNALIVVASYVFYGWWDWRFLILIAFTSLCSFASGLLIQYGKRPKYFLVLNVVLNLAILGFFKYFNFFVESFTDFLALIGVSINTWTLNIILPVGISFYTFQALSYSIDVYKGKLEPTKDIVAFFAYVSFFPQLVAGPIERATNLLPQFHSPRQFNYDDANDGLRQMLWGLFKKIVIADNCSVLVDLVFNNYPSHSGITLALAAVLFTFQIYGDFSGYSDIAIGCARLFGIRLMRNFNVPYFSRDIAEFWRRWHISLTTWFRDYIYIPLGGSRVSKAKIVRNTFIIFLVSGFWHGANWTFIAWGAYHALLFLPLILLGKNRKYIQVVAEGKFFPSFHELCQMMLTFLLVVLGWIIFRADSIQDAYHYFCGLTLSGPLTVTFGKTEMFTYLFWPSLMLLMEWISRDKPHALAFNKNRIPVALRWCLYILLIAIICLNVRVDSPFIYFQF